MSFCLRKKSLFILGLAVLILGGCSTWNPLCRRDQSPDDVVQIGGKTKLVGDLARPTGDFPVQVEGIGLVTGLSGTGSDPAPSGQRGILLDNMKTHSVVKPSKILASTSTSMVLVRGVLRPGIQKGDRFDLEIRVPSRSETSSLGGGWLLDTRLNQLAVLSDKQLHSGRLWGHAEGPILIDPSADTEKNPVMATRGLILGGGRCVRDRLVGIHLKEKHQNVRNAAQIEKAINRRFHRIVGGLQQGVAKATNDKHIEISIHPRYKDNIKRYLQVVRAVAVRESTLARADRIALLQEQLTDPTMARGSAIQLEAIGKEGIDSLKAALVSDHIEVKFAAAEALAYLDQTEAAEPLGKIAREQPAFRVFALSALGAMDDYAAYEQLCELLDTESAETRYGAFRALWSMNPNDRRIRGAAMSENFSYHLIASKGPAMVHITRNTRPEIVVFGEQQSLRTPLLLEAGPHIRISSNGGDNVSISRFLPGKADQKRVVSNKLDDVVRTVGELGGTYPDLVGMLSDAKKKNVLTSRFEVDALPQAGRTFHRETVDLSDSQDDEEAVEVAESSWWNFWSKPSSEESDSAEEEPELPESTEQTNADEPAGSST
jgi:flagellar P-ring protein FlgI